jgi:hypothetical protein
MPTDHGPLCWRALHLPKRGHAAEEYEDAFAADPGAGRFAVADGASESAFAALWARLLTEGFVGGVRTPWGKAEWLAPVRQRWAGEVDPQTLPWYAELKREQGAFATLLGLALRPPREGRPGRWRALAVGDSCLLRLHDGELVDAFPLDRSADFDTAPPLVGSRPANGARRSAARQACGTWRAGDRFLLLTDALAQWALRRTEEDREPWDELGPLFAAANPQEAFAVWIEELRDRDQLRNDDVTLVTVGLGT